MNSQGTNFNNMMCIVMENVCCVYCDDNGTVWWSFYLETRLKPKMKKKKKFRHQGN